MKIFYAVQATGNGHISRAMQITPWLQKMGEVDIFLSGSNSSLKCTLPIKYRSRGISLYNTDEGGLDYLRIIKSNSYIRACREARDLPIEKYDVVINDFEPITSKACKLKNKKSIQFSHQASFRSQFTPRPLHTDLIGEWIFKQYSVSTKYIGLHFKSYDDFILPPIIKEDILNAVPNDRGHISVYLFSYGIPFFEKYLKRLPDVRFECFVPDLPENKTYQSGNISFQPIDQHLFNRSLIDCHGIITGGGFETPSEALYLKKKLMVIPVHQHYEQNCNVVALNKLGVASLNHNEMSSFDLQIRNWLNKPMTAIDLSSCNLKETIQKVVDIGVAD